MFFQRFPITYVLRAQKATCVLSPGIFIQAMWCPKTDVLNSFRNLLQSGDGTSAKKLVEDFDIQHGDPSIVLTERERKDRFAHRAKNQTAVFSRVHFFSKR